MELKSILSGLEGLKVKGNLDINVNEIRNSSNQVENGDMFVAIDGFDTDGHKYISEAIKKGAKVIMAQTDKVTKETIKELPDDVTIILAPNTRHAIAICACNFYKNPSEKRQNRGGGAGAPLHRRKAQQCTCKRRRPCLKCPRRHSGGCLSQDFRTGYLCSR